MLNYDKEPEEMYTIDVHNRMYRPEKGILGHYIIIRKIKDSNRIDVDNIEIGTWIFEELEEAQEEMGNPECSRCGKVFGLDDRLYYGKARTFTEFPENDLYCRKCKQANRVAQEI